MGTRGLQWQTVHVPLAAGMETKEDVRFSSPPRLERAVDVEFELVGGMQTRHPFSAMSNSIQGGGTLSNCRRLAVVNDELCVFTDSALYSYNASRAKWVRRDTHLAVSVTETPRCVTTKDQIDGDRAELNGTVVYAWVESTQVYASAIDKTTSSVLVPPTAVGGAVNARAVPRLVALDSVILLFVYSAEAGGALRVRELSYTDPATGIASAGTLVKAANFSGLYDVQRAGTQNLVVGAAVAVGGASYDVFRVAQGPAVTAATKARTVTGAIAVAPTADGTQTQIARDDGGALQVLGDLITTATLADVFTGQVLGATTTNVYQIAAAFVGTTCTVVWQNDQSTGISPNNMRLDTNTVTTANVIGTMGTVVLNMALASRAFVQAGNVYVWAAWGSDSTAFGSGSPLGVRAQLQNTYFLFRADGLLVSKAVWNIAGGFAASSAHLPGVTAVSSTAFVWLGAYRRRIELGDDIDHTGLAARGLMEIAFSFDADAARRTAQLGRTLYVSSGLVSTYDGMRVSELGFQVYPWAFIATDGGVGGNLSIGTYAWKATMKWTNAAGEMERSTTATGETVTFAAANHKASLGVAYLFATNKKSSVPNVEIWRTLVNSGTDAPFFLTTSQDPTATGNNRYIANDYTNLLLLYTDALSDTTLETREANPENGGLLESLAPPGATIVLATDTRLFIAGVSGDPDRVWYSRERREGEIASFHDVLTIDVPPVGGAITALWFQDGTLFVGRETAIYAIPGTGLDNLGAGQGFGPAQAVSLDVGPVSQEAQALTPVGTLLSTSKGWYLLQRGAGLRYVGGPVSAYDADTVKAVHVLTAKHQVRILTGSRLLVWDYRGAVDANIPDPAGQWAEWTVSGGLDAVLWNGTYTYLTTSGPQQEQTSYSGLTYGLVAETSWIKLADLQGYGKVRALAVLGEFRSNHALRIQVARDYEYDGFGNVVYYDDKAWSPSPAVPGSALQVRHSVSGSNGKCEAIKVRLSAVTLVGHATLATTALAVLTSGTDWNATWQAVALGPIGNTYTLALAFVDGAPFSVDVRDHFTWQTASSRWVEAVGTVGVLVTCRAGSTPTVAQLEAAIAAGSTLIQLSAADPAPAKTIDAAAMAGSSPSDLFAGADYGQPSGEALRLTGLALELGIDPRAYKRLPAAQKQ